MNPIDEIILAFNDALETKNPDVLRVLEDPQLMEAVCAWYVGACRLGANDTQLILGLVGFGAWRAAQNLRLEHLFEIEGRE